MKPPRYWPLVFALAVPLVILALGWRPFVAWQAREKLAKDYPWLRPSEVRALDLGTIELRGVEVDRGWVRGRLDRVTVAVKERSARIDGGHLDLDLDARPVAGGGGEKKQVVAQGLSVHVKKGSWKGKAQGVAWDGTAATFESGEAEGPQGKGMFERGRYVPHAELTLAFLKVEAPMPRKIPGLTADKLTAQVYDVTVDEAHRELRIRQGGALDVVEFDDAKATLGSDGEVVFQLGWARVNHPWVSAKGEKLVWVQGTANREGLKLSSPLNAFLSFEAPKGSVWGRCSDWSQTVAGDTPLSKLTFSGRLEIDVAIQPTPSLKLDASCAPTSCEAFKSLRSRFTYTAYNADGSPFERTTGPLAPDWVPVAAAGKMPQAVENLEDPGFQYHRGFIRQAYENSLIENVKAGRFVRGGSTLTMQLAKNLYLGRDKTLWRKAQELLLAMALEKCFTKAEIMNLYLNVVEFGPNTYGVGPGARLWFKKAPAALDLTEAFWMASILPAPRKANPPTETSLRGIEKLMTRLAEQGKIPGFTGNVEGVDATGWEQTP